MIKVITLITFLGFSYGASGDDVVVGNGKGF